MIDESMIIAGSAASIGFVHTILGPDHYLPLVAMAKTNGWSATKTAIYVEVSGVSPLLGTLVVGSLVFLLGFAFLNIETVQALRSNFAGWFLILFGLVYFVWGAKWAIRHDRTSSQPKNSNFSRCTPFALFLFFILGPCEPLLPLMSIGSESDQVSSSILVVSAFCGTTILTMLACVMFFYYGVSRISFFLRFEKYMHAVTGLIVFLCGCAIQFLGY